ncbi:MAG: argininosuccinate synthase, partial [Candidatus Magasanikbacteria bacterium]|nr:argininosuccinate synthase [Candidatus Magasanikbacteria bacterium]
KNKFKEIVDQEWAYLCYGGLWYEPLMKDLSGFIDTLNEKVTGTVTMRLFKGHAEVVALKTPNALFDEKLATFMKSDLFNQNASPGFIELWSLQMKMAKQNKKSILLTIGGQESKESLLPEAKIISDLGCIIYATENTSKFLDQNGIANRLVYKISAENKPNIADLLRERRFDLVINIPSSNGATGTDGEKIRALAVENNITLVTNIEVAKSTVQQLKNIIADKMQ